MKTRSFIEQKSVTELFNATRQMYISKYYNLWQGSYKWDGLDFEQSNYLMKQLWATGCIAGYKIPMVNELGLANFATQTHNMYDFPERVQLINKWNIPFIPKGTQIVNTDVVILYAQANQKPIKSILDYYIDRITQIDMVINTNLQIHKLPFVVAVDPDDIDKAKDIINRILSNELAVFSDLSSLQSVKTLATSNQYIIDKLYLYKNSLEDELLTYLGIDNSISDPTKQQMLIDEVNANNAIININKEGFLRQLKGFCNKVRELFNIIIDVEPVVENVTSLHEQTETEEENVK